MKSIIIIISKIIILSSQFVGNKGILYQEEEVLFVNNYSLLLIQIIVTENVFKIRIEIF